MSTAQKLITTVNRGRRARPTPSQQPGKEPNESQTMQTPEPKCAPDKIRGKTVPHVTTRITYEQRRRLAELARKRESELPFVEIEEVFFTIFSTDEIKAMSVTEITNTEQFGPGSINDPQMGPTDNSLCPTCSRDNIECPGHYGYIQLPEAMPHPLLLREIIAILNCVCNDCGGLLLSTEDIRNAGLQSMTGAKRLTRLEKASENLPCRRPKDSKDRRCLPNPKYKATKTRDTNQVTYEYVQKGEKKESYHSGQEILDIFNSISDEDAKELGYSNGAHPRRMIMEVLMVIPPRARPAAAEDGKYKPDPLTTMYIDIIRHSKNLKNFIESGADEEKTRQKGERKAKKELSIQDLRKNLFDRIKHFINNTDGWYTGNGEPLKSLTHLIQSKEGLIRGNMMAKRVDWSARTVLSPDPWLAFGQISVPLAIAPIMTPKELINRYNRNEMQNLLVKGRITYITFSDNAPEGQLSGTRVQVTENYRKSYQLRDGDTVERWLQDGDIVIFDRQPTLHKYSFLGLRAVLRDQKTFGLGLWYTTPTNAD